MAKLFIDANILLGFYNQKHSTFEKIISLLHDVGDDVFITTQIRDEVYRNKLEVAKATYKDMLSKSKLNSIDLMPQHKTAEQTTIIEEYRKIKQQSDNVLNALSLHIDNTLKDIAQSKDIVSCELHHFFKKSIEPKQSQIERAIQRKQFGLPPGKSRDPIGDELSWIQLLDAYNGNETIWIVTRDSDYFTQIGSDYILNPILYEELKIKSSPDDPDVRIFPYLVTALKNYRSFKTQQTINDISYYEMLSDEKKSGIEKISNLVTDMTYAANDKMFTVASKFFAPSPESLYFTSVQKDQDLLKAHDIIDSSIRLIVDACITLSPKNVASKFLRSQYFFIFKETIKTYNDTSNILMYLNTTENVITSRFHQEEHYLIWMKNISELKSIIA